MSTPHVVISGASIAGLAAAAWLRRTGWEVTVLERAPAFRAGGQNVDVRGTAREVLDRMRLVDAVTAHHTTETGTAVLDRRGRVIAAITADEGGADGPTAELEVLRGDLAEILRDALPDGVVLAYDESVAAVEEQGDHVVVRTTAGRALTAQLLVVAEGVRSTTRDLVLADAVTLDDLGVTMAFGTIPRTADDDRRWRWYTTDRSRQVHLRPDNHGTTRALLAYRRSKETEPADGPFEVADELARMRERYADVGWEAPRVLDGFATSDDVYVDRMAQVRMSTYRRGRVCVVGDAAWCVTPMGGGGASLALVGAYVLAAYLSELDADDLRDPDRLDAALGRYEDWMHPVADDAQGIPGIAMRAAYPATRLGVDLRNLVVRVALARPFRRFAARFGGVARAGKDLPELRETVGS